jgi:hypothetical protein
MRDGFPDLMLEKDGTVSFMQIKAEGDVIRRNQLTRLRQLGNAGIRAEIGRVDYRFDPEQDYVVVDVETTGSWASGDRITEIGAVKIRNHQVVDEWHSLLNPQRTIPARITQITNITNEMVRDAPIFSESRTASCSSWAKVSSSPTTSISTVSSTTNMNGLSAAFVFRSCAPSQECVADIRGISPMALENSASSMGLNSKRTTGPCAMPVRQASF